MFLLEHQDGNVQYEFKSGGFAYSKRRLYISIESQALNEDDFPRDFKFAIYGKSMLFGIGNRSFSVIKAKRDKQRDVFVYTTFHAMAVGAELNVNLLESDELSVEFKLATEDVVYYDDRAKPSIFGGNIVLDRKAIEDMWFPS